MAESEAIDSYFTRQIVGEMLVVSLGRADSVQQKSDHAAWVDELAERAVIVGAAARGLWVGDPSLVIPGRPVSPSRFRSTRRALVLGAIVAWSLALWFAFRALHA